MVLACYSVPALAWRTCWLFSVPFVFKISFFVFTSSTQLCTLVLIWVVKVLGKESSLDFTRLLRQVISMEIFIPRYCLLYTVFHPLAVERCVKRLWGILNCVSFCVLLALLDISTRKKRSTLVSRWCKWLKLRPKTNNLLEKFRSIVFAYPATPLPNLCFFYRQSNVFPVLSSSV